MRLSAIQIGAGVAMCRGIRRIRHRAAIQKACAAWAGLVVCIALRPINQRLCFQKKSRTLELAPRSWIATSGRIYWGAAFYLALARGGMKPQSYFCNCARMASPICDVESVEVALPLISAVRIPASSTSEIAFSMRSAASPRLKE